MFAFAAAAAALPTILGLQLGGPVGLAECQRMVLQYPHSDGSPAPYTSVQPRHCIEHDDAPKDGLDSGMIYFPPEAMGSIMSFNWISDRLINGQLSELGVATLDYNHAAYIVDQLTMKFGKPSSDDQSSEDLDSIDVPSRVVVWRGPGFRAEYRSVNKSVERGLFLIQTDEALSAREQESAKAKAQETPL